MALHLSDSFGAANNRDIWLKYFQIPGILASTLDWKHPSPKNGGRESSSSGDTVQNPHWIRVAEEDEAMKIGPWVRLGRQEEEGILGGQIRGGGGCKL